LSKEPGDRFASAAEMRAALAEQRATPAEQETAPRPPTPAPARRRRAPLPGWFWPVVGGAAVLLIAVLVALAVLLGGGGDGAGTETAEPTQVAGIAEATVTLIPRPSHTALPPEATASPTSTALPTDTPQPAPTRTPRPTSTPRATPTRTRAPTRTAAPTATATKKPAPTSTPVPELLVTWEDLHYECQGYLELTQGRPPHETVSGYRSFQALLVIANQTADSTLEPPWMPERWIITDGQREWEETYAWQWAADDGGLYEQPAIGPGATASRTWLCYPLPEGAWVKAADFTAWGHTYRFEFPKPEPGEFNYHACP
jgi:hypothetical protein